MEKKNCLVLSRINEIFREIRDEYISHIKINDDDPNDNSKYNLFCGVYILYLQEIQKKIHEIETLVSVLHPSFKHWEVNRKDLYDFCEFRTEKIDVYSKEDVKTWVCFYPEEK